MGRPSDARARLIEAARQVFFSQSYTAVSVDELCAAAGVNKSSFYHFFPSKQELILAAIDTQWQWFEQVVLHPLFTSDLPPHEQILRFFEMTLEKQRALKLTTGFMQGCPAGNLTLEMSTQDEAIRVRIEQFFQAWLGYFEHMLEQARVQGIAPATLDVPTTAQALLAYFEGVMLLAKGRNDPSLLHTLRLGVLALMQVDTPATSNV
ncbi:MAG TPA: TetR/AcrR family transcriptional regulator [Ktedonobacteraceae bacterium]|nr:TetR/AcrR family transcriptional regulator [Ktedonobacteraceae bacterium]